MYALVFVVAFYQVAGEIAPVYGVHRREELAVSGRVEFHAIVANELERNIGVRECDFLHYIAHGIGFGDVLFHELRSRRNVVEQVADNDSRAVGTAALLMRYFAASLDAIESSVGLVLLLGHDLYSCDSRNRSESFSAEAEGIYVVEVLFCDYLARRVAEKRSRHIVKSHAAAVVADAHIGRAAVFYLDGDMLCAGIYRIFDKLLYN